MRLKIIIIDLILLIIGMCLYDTDDARGQTEEVKGQYIAHVIEPPKNYVITIPHIDIPDPPIEEKTEPEVVSEEQEEEYNEPYSANDDVVMTIASVVEAETKGQDVESKIHIVHVIRNRVNSGSFPNDYVSVCTVGNQFASRWDIEQSTIDAVHQGLAMDDTTNGALFFCLCKESCWLNGTQYSYLFTDTAGHHFWG